MVSWKLLPEDHPDEAWDEALLGLADQNVFQSSAWARHKKAAGWTAVRALATAADGPVAAVQFLVKRGAGAAVFWSRGGPVGEPASWGEGLRCVLKDPLGPLGYLRICSYREEDPSSLEALSRNGWGRPAKTLDRNLTFVLDVSRPEKDLLSGLSRNWGHNLRRGLKRSSARLWKDPRAKDLIAVYRDMENYKGTKSPYDARELSSLLSSLSEKIVLVRSDGPDGRPIALRACAVHGGKAWDLLAASSEAGRKSYASYSLLWSLIRHCQAIGVKSYDLGGADPDGAKGVHDFKKGTGARLVRYLGEWDRATPSLLRLPAGLAVGLMAKRL